MGILIYGIDETHLRVERDIETVLAIDGDGIERGAFINVSDGSRIHAVIGPSRIWRLEFTIKPSPDGWDVAKVRLASQPANKPVESDRALIWAPVTWIQVGHGPKITG